MKYLFLINPKAQAGRLGDIEKDIEKYKKDNEFVYKYTQTAKEAYKYAEKAKGEGYDLVVSVGGDGTLISIIPALLCSDLELGILPLGTGNDAVKSLGIECDFEKAMARLLSGSAKSFDVIKCNEKYCFNILSMGFDADVVAFTNKYKKYLPKKLAYHIGVFVNLFKFKNIELRIEADDIKLKDEFFLTAVGNGKYYGGGIKILPFANIKDGKLDIVVAKARNIVQVLELLIKLTKSKHLEDEKVTYFQTDRLTIIPSGKLNLNIDGELLEISGRQEIQVLKKAVKIRI